jgi:hypothetical protein
MKKFLYWFLAVVITLVLSIYQRMTGPTYPKKLTVELRGESYQVKLPRSGVQQDVLVKLPIPEDLSHELESDQTPPVPMSLHYRRFPTSDEYTSVDYRWKDGEWKAALPVQPVAGKLQYYLTIGGKDYLKDEPVVIRFRNDVPAGILIPHILLMFGAMLLAVYTFLLVVTGKDYAKWLKLTVGIMFVGGFVFGPLVQHAAFGPWWTGFPYGTDLTDNKTLLSFLFFLAALATLKWKYNKWVVCAAVVFMVLIFSIPHSAYGSEYDYSAQQLK